MLTMVTFFGYTVDMAWFRRKTQQRDALLLPSDPVLADFLGMAPRAYAGVSVGENSALALSAVYRAVSLISGTLAGLTLRTLRVADDGSRVRVGSFLDDPNAPAQTAYEWMETICLHLLLHGNAFLAHVYNGAGALAGLTPVHPLAVSVDWEKTGDGKLTGRKRFDATLSDGQRISFTEDEMTHIPALSLDGLRGLSPIALARNSLSTAVAADRAAAKLFADGALVSGLVTPEEDLAPGEAQKIMDQLNSKVAGWENAAKIAVINRKLKFSPWMLSAVDAQFLESRQFQVEEIARWYGVPPHLLMQTEKQTSWGTGVAEQNRGLARFTLAPWAHRIERRLSRLLPGPRFCEFDFASLERPTPEQEIDLLIQQVNAGLMTVNEARKIRNMPPIDGGDKLRVAPWMEGAQ